MTLMIWAGDVLQCWEAAGNNDENRSKSLNTSSVSDRTLKLEYVR